MENKNFIIYSLPTYGATKQVLDDNDPETYEIDELIEELETCDNG